MAFSNTKGLYVVLSIFLFTPFIAFSQNIQINEVLASNGDGIIDEDQDNEDWIELYNASNQSINLQGYGLSDDPDQPSEWVLPAVTLESDEYMLIFASGKDRSNANSELHTSFQIDQDGEELILSDPDGNIIDQFPSTEIPTDISYGRKPDGADDWYFFEVPTPGEPNTTDGLGELLDPPSFSMESGFYRSSSSLHLSTEHPNSVIRYTLDGSVPDATSPVYQEPIQIKDRTNEPNHLSNIRTTPAEADDKEYKWYKPQGQMFKGTVVRSRVFKEGAKPSKTVTNTYFVHAAGGDRYHLPVVSIVTDSVNLFGKEEGIYVPGKIYEENGFGEGYWGDHANYFERGDAWERPASFELFDEQGEIEFNQDIGIRIHGGGSRAVPLKSFRLYARNEYGDNRFNHEIFPQLPYDEYDRLILRNSGQDFMVLPTMYHDVFVHELVNELNFDTMAYRATIVFVNGEYWGIMNLRERYDEDYIGRTYDVDEDNIDYLENNQVVKQGSSEHYSNMLSYIESNDLSEDKHYQEVKTRMDVNNYIDYIIAKTFVANDDWPGNNTDYWRLRTNGYQEGAPVGKDGRWRWMFYDADYSFGDNLDHYEADKIATITEANGPSYPNPPWSTFLFRNFLKNDQFKYKFLNRYADLLNSTFHPSQILSLLTEFEGKIDPVIEEHIDRWGHPTSRSYWDFNVNRMREFAQNRRTYSLKHLMNHFGISDTIHVSLAVSSEAEGQVKINSLLVEDAQSQKGKGYPWTGTYFSGTPITLEAVPKPGYAFAKWEGVETEIAEDSVITISSSESQEVKATFKRKSIQITPHRLSEGNYEFNEWQPGQPAGNFPESMAFVYMGENEPGISSTVDDLTEGAYNLDSRTRINGLGQNGFSFVNTENLDGNPGYPGLKLGGALLALDTRNSSDITVEWTAGTVEPNSRVYNVRLQYRVGTEGNFQDLLDDNGNPVEYERNAQEGHTEVIGPVMLPDSLEEQPVVQLLWRYYFTGVREDQDSGARSQLNISQIRVGTAENVEGQMPKEFALKQNFPNPFNPSTEIPYELPEQSHVRIEVYDIVGRRIAILLDEEMPAGRHTVSFSGQNLSSSIYFYRIVTDNFVESKKMVLIK